MQSYIHSYSCKSPVTCFAHKGDYVVVGCRDGWFSLLNINDGVLWSKKVTATYYRGPYTDVNVLSVDLDGRYVAVGTDFADGKLYLYSTDGELQWYRQFITIPACWERPDDVTYVRINNDRIYAGSEWINSFLHVYDLKGNMIMEKKYEGSFRGVEECGGKLIVATSQNLYVEDRALNMKVGNMKMAKYIVVSNPSGLHVVDCDGNLKWSFKAANPLFTVDGDNIIIYDSKLKYLSLDGDVLREVEIEKPIFIEKVGDVLILGYENKVKFVDGDGKICEVLEVDGTPFYSEGHIISINRNKICIYGSMYK